MRHCKPCGQVIEECWCEDDDETTEDDDQDEEPE